MHLTTRLSAVLALAATIGTVAVAQILPPTQLTASDAAANRYFGNSVAVSGDVMVVGAPLSTVTTNADGSVYVYRWNGTTWAQEARIPGPSAVSGSSTDFGRSVAISGETIVVGASLDDPSAGTDAGAAYVYSRVGGVWTFQQRLTASDGAASDNFGDGVSIDGDTIVVTAPSDDITANTDQGSAYVFLRTGAAWAQQQKLTASNGAASDLLGRGGAVSISGDTIAIGSRNKASNAGRVYLYNRIITTWTESTILTSPDVGTDATARFGSAVSLSGDTLAVGALTSSIGGTDRGSVYLYQRAGGTWPTTAQRLSAFDATNGDNFGISVSVSGDSLLVGAAGKGSNRGQAYVFRFVDGSWSSQGALAAPDGAAGDFFGWSVALDGNVALVGAQQDSLAGPINAAGSAWAFSRVGTRWILNDPTLANPVTPNVNTLNPSDFFGVSTAIDGDTIASGAFYQTVTATRQGSVYVLMRNGTQFAEQARLVAAGAAVDDFFGRSVAVSGNTLVGGAIGRDPLGRLNAGSAVVFTRSGTTWTQQAELIASDAAANDSFGFASAVSGDTIAIGAPFAGSPGIPAHGAVYIFTRSGSTWTQRAKLVHPSPAANDNFGYAVSISGDNLLIGASSRAVSGRLGQGSAYLYIREGTGFRFLQQITANNGAANDIFGVSVAINGNDAIIGARGRTSNQGAAYIFTRQPNGTFSQTAVLTADDGRAEDFFGLSVAISGPNAFVGACLADIGTANDAGALYGFTSTSGLATGPWVQTRKFARRANLSNDFVGFSAAASGLTAVVGGYNAASGRGAIWVIDQPDALTQSAVNITASNTAPNLESAVQAATAGQTVVGSAGSFNASSVDFSGRAFTTRSLSSIALNSNSLLNLSNGAVLAAAPGSPVSLFGTARTLNDSGRSDITGASIRQSGGGTLFVGKHEVSLNALSSELAGRVSLLDAASSISSSGQIAFTGVLNDLFGGRLTSGGGMLFDGVVNLRKTTISAGGPIRISTQGNMSPVTISGPALIVGSGARLNLGGEVLSNLDNSGKIIFTTSSTIIGSLVNNTNAEINTSGFSLSVFGPFTGSGTINAAPGGCPNCLQQPATLSVFDDVRLGSTSSTSITGVMEIAGDFRSDIVESDRFAMLNGTIRMNNSIGRAVQNFEVQSRDFGPAGAAMRPYINGSFPLGSLEVGPASTTVNLVNSVANAGGTEALYVDRLVVGPGSRLNTRGIRVYARTLELSGTVDSIANIIPLGQPCNADLVVDAFVDDLDFGAFVAAYNVFDCASPEMTRGCYADLNADGLVDDRDFVVFAEAYNQFLCD